MIGWDSETHGYLYLEDGYVNDFYFDGEYNEPANRRMREISARIIRMKVSDWCSAIAPCDAVKALAAGGYTYDEFHQACMDEDGDKVGTMETDAAYALVSAYYDNPYFKSPLEEYIPDHIMGKHLGYTVEDLWKELDRLHGEDDGNLGMALSWVEEQAVETIANALDVNLAAYM